MVRSTSLRARLMIVILVPLVLISLLAGFWRFTAARSTSELLFDRTLVALTLAIARDVVVSGGDALSPATLDLMRDTSGGGLFYHVNGPDGVFLTGYAYPPAMPIDFKAVTNVPVLFEAVYRGGAVRVARLSEMVTFDGVSGYSTVTVWQSMAAREAFALQLALRAALVMGLLIVTVGGVVWFGVNIGLRPLIELEGAIATRSPDDLSVIRRRVPVEVSGIVDILNTLFGEVSRAIVTRNRFISDAAHQMRNPVAGILSMAVAARDAPSEAERRSRSGELVEAARHASRLTQQLLSFERVRGLADKNRFQREDLTDLVRGVCRRNVARCFENGVELAFEDHAADCPVAVLADRVMLREAVQNLIDNALAHAGPENTAIEVSVAVEGAHASVTVRDFGRGLAVDQIETAFERFGQLDGGEGSGLGLAIVKETARQHGGVLAAVPVEPGASFTISLPVSGPDPEEPRM
ncbi:sensor histidine kinase [Breoghania sp. L-A4]|nr:sensor histidine kinase [Breoghania sp. L-A4]